MSYFIKQKDKYGVSNKVIEPSRKEHHAILPDETELKGLDQAPKKDRLKIKDKMKNDVRDK